MYCVYILYYTRYSGTALCLYKTLWKNRGYWRLPVYKSGGSIPPAVGYYNAPVRLCNAL